jgi:hypothetical protein
MMDKPICLDERVLTKYPDCRKGARFGKVATDISSQMTLRNRRLF